MRREPTRDSPRTDTAEGGPGAGRQRIGFLTTVLPHTARGGGEIVSGAFIEAMRTAGHSVTVVGYLRRGDPRPTGGRSIAVAERTIETDAARRREVARWILLGMARREPYSAAKYRSRAYLAALRTVLADGCDLVVVDHAQLGWLAPALTAWRCPVVFIAHNSEHALYRSVAAAADRLAKRQMMLRESRTVERLERRLASLAIETWALTGDDVRTLSSLGASAVRRFDVPPAFGPPREAEKCFDVGLIGSWTWEPNAVGLRWFLDAVVPRLPDELTIEVAGDGAEWVLGRHPNVRYRGYESEPRRFLSQARVVAVPALRDGGLQIKTLDAVASGSSVVATPFAARGLADLPATVRTADDPSGFAEATAELARGAAPQEGLRLALDWWTRRTKRFRAEVADAVSRVTSGGG